MSSFLYHGPGAREKALSRQSEGRRLGGPFGEGGLKIEDARNVLSLFDRIPPGRKKCMITVGPLNKATPASIDVLLKSVEEPPRKVEIILWAEDLNGVLPTMISRCWPVWCPGEEMREREEEARIFATYFSPLILLSFAVLGIRDYQNRIRELSALYNSLHERHRETRRNVSDQMEEKIKRVIDFIKENYESPISMKGLAEAVDMNTYYFSRKFMDYTGKKMNDYINEVRVREAAERLNDEDLRIIDAAYGTGFESLSTWRMLLVTASAAPSL